MAITSYDQNQFGQLTVVTVVSDLVGSVFYHWYVDGAYVAFTTTPQYSIYLDFGEQVRIDVNDTTDPDYDAISNAPAGHPARRTLVWTRTIDLLSGVKEYRVEQDIDGGGYVKLAKVARNGDQWVYVYLTSPLTDLSVYTWKIYADDFAGNPGVAALTYGPETVVRRPVAPDFTVSFDGGTTKVTFAAA